jgi:hypothetical protein
MTRRGRPNIAGGFVYAEHRASQPARGDHLAPRRRQRQQRERKAAGEALCRLSSLSLLAAQERQIDFPSPRRECDSDIWRAVQPISALFGRTHDHNHRRSRADLCARRIRPCARERLRGGGRGGSRADGRTQARTEIAFSVAIADGHVTPGKARLLRSDAASVGDGEIRVSVVKHDSSPYADLTASEKTSASVDFVATGLIGDIKIDEVKLCGRLDAPTSAHIYSGSWRISLNRFSVGHGGEACP